jgi:hypothetical protein
MAQVLQSRCGTRVLGFKRPQCGRVARRVGSQALEFQFAR